MESRAKRERKIDFSERPLKQVPIRQIEEAIGQVLGGLVGQKYSVSVRVFNFEPDEMAFARDAMDLPLRIERKFSSALVEDAAEPAAEPSPGEDR